MDQRRTPEYTLDLTADRSHVKDVVKGILHTIFFHRYFTPLYPATHEILDLTLPFVTEDDIDTLIESRTTSLLRQLDSLPPSGRQSSPHYISLSLQFLERKRRRTWFLQKPDEETPWETWHINVLLTSARSETEALRNRDMMGRGLERAVWKVLEIVNAQRGHIPPITTNESNPFPFDLKVKRGGQEGWGGKMGIF
ncbi:hypothetical protein Slin15195_G046070 [Septoria linicola]|uniref:Autophagy-related protein 101 n=1 Tax=Septoria linicola TaxID=215465 RepID=A0A9Q9EJF7_9PEZI|nr:hypothetical protein Slin14017_G049600 [Septoria linicola]USW51288.1 hypothetical protein Slin15195_G046070 [Septoria linicola]